MPLAAVLAESSFPLGFLSSDFCPHKRAMWRGMMGNPDATALMCTQQCTNDTECTDVGSPGKEYLCCSSGCGRICTPAKTRGKLRATTKLAQIRIGHVE